MVKQVATATLCWNSLDTTTTSSAATLLGTSDGKTKTIQLNAMVKQPAITSLCWKFLDIGDHVKRGDFGDFANELIAYRGASG